MNLHTDKSGKPNKKCQKKNLLGDFNSAKKGKLESFLDASQYGYVMCMDLIH